MKFANFTLNGIIMPMSLLVSLSVLGQSCGVNSTSSDFSNITAVGEVSNYVAGKSFAISENIRRALLSAYASASINAHELYGSSGVVEGIGIAGGVWSSSSNGYYTAIENVTRIYPEQSIIYAYVEGAFQAVGSYTQLDDGSIKEIAELCTGSYRNACNLDFTPGTKRYAFKQVK